MCLSSCLSSYWYLPCESCEFMSIFLYHLRLSNTSNLFHRTLWVFSFFGSTLGSERGECILLISRILSRLYTPFWQFHNNTSVCHDRTVSSLVSIKTDVQQKILETLRRLSLLEFDPVLCDSIDSTIHTLARLRLSIASVLSAGRHLVSTRNLVAHLKTV